MRPCLVDDSEMMLPVIAVEIAILNLGDKCEPGVGVSAG